MLCINDFEHAGFSAFMITLYVHQKKVNYRIFLDYSIANTVSRGFQHSSPKEALNLRHFVSFLPWNRTNLSDNWWQEEWI